MTSPTENLIVRSCRRLLDCLKAERKLTYRRINVSGVRRSIGNRTIFTKNEMAGMEDFQVYLRTLPPVVMHVECKSDSGILSLSQKRWRDELASVGHLDYYVVRRVEELAAALRQYGITYWAYERT